jgi:hypothetical protein
MPLMDVPPLNRCLVGGEKPFSSLLAMVLGTERMVERSLNDQVKAFLILIDQPQCFILPTL